MVEIWKAVVGFEGRYEVSDLGRVRSLDFRSAHRLHKGKLRKLYLFEPKDCKTSYWTINLRKGDGSQNQKKVHRLVAAAFLGPEPEGMCVCHNDGNGMNNRLNNLRYDTMAGNNEDKVKHGVAGWKLSASQVLAIRSLVGEFSGIELAEEFGVTTSHISNILTGKTWKHLLA